MEPAGQHGAWRLTFAGQGAEVRSGDRRCNRDADPAEPLVAEYGFAGNCPRIAAELGYTAAELARLHRRFEVVPGAQAQVGRGAEGGVLACAGIAKVYSFHISLTGGGSSPRNLACVAIGAPSSTHDRYSAPARKP